ncbi:hypothetical protein LJC72_12490 [Bacteroides sp. OttesenSCG-928-D19]|nr:hypothetical protein [Bacteroides sp. OttesenSCG-928-D19]
MANNNERTVIHLQIGDKHEYFGSPSSLYDKHSSEELGISQASLNNYFYKLQEGVELIYTNSKCIIRKGTLYVKPTTRGRKKATL